MPAIHIDEQTLRRINAGDERAFAELYDAYFTYLCVCATVFTHDAARAQEIVNDLFVSIWNRRETLRWPIHPYLLKALRNGCINHLRDLKNRQRLLHAYRDDLLDFRIDQAASATPLEYAELTELADSVRRIADSLPDRCRRIFHLYFYEGLDAREIGQQLGLTASTVRVQLKIALDRMRRQLGPTVAALILFGLEQ